MNHVSQTKGKNRSSRRYTHPTLAQTSRENGAPTVWKSETKSTTGKRTGHPAQVITGPRNRTVSPTVKNRMEVKKQE